MTDDYLGRRLSDVLPMLRAEGFEPVIVETSAPGKEKREGTLRIIRVRGNELVVAAFPDGTPE